MTKEIDLHEIVYQLTIEDIQTVAEEILERKLTREEIDKLIEPIGEYVPWFEAIARAIYEVIPD